MYIVPEKDIAALVGAEDSFEAVRQVFGAMAAGSAYNFPVIREAIGHAYALYGFKSGFDRQGLNLGLKSGGYWPGNTAKGLTNHQSTVFLFDAETGKCRAIVGGNLLTALRTAAQRRFRSPVWRERMRACWALSARAIRRRFNCGPWRRSAGLNALWPGTAAQKSLPALALWPGNLAWISRRFLGAQADVIITITSSYAAILTDAHVKPGTHIACMGTDTKGKQEVEAALVARASLFTDEVAQSVSIGECQHAIAAGLVAPDAIAVLGAVINGTHPGRQSDDEITLFDGTGVGLQDLAVAATAVQRAIEQGRAIEVAF